MHFFPSSIQFSNVALLLLPTLFASAHPHLQRSQPDKSTEIKLFEYPGAVGEDMTPVATIALEQPRYGHEPEGLYYEFEWEEPDRASRPAKATRVGESGYDQLVATLKHYDTYITSGQDDKHQIWVVTTREVERGRQHRTV